MVRQRMNCNAPLFSSDDYDFIMQRHDERPRKKVLDELMDKYNTSMKRIYQIWRGEEGKRVAWDQLIPQFHNEIHPESKIQEISNIHKNSPETVSNAYTDGEAEHRASDSSDMNNTYQNKVSLREEAPTSKKKKSAKLV